MGEQRDAAARAKEDAAREAKRRARAAETVPATVRRVVAEDAGLLRAILDQSTYTEPPKGFAAQWGCRLWTGPTNTRGEGWLRWRGQTYDATRTMWQAMYGALDQGEELIHACGRSTCIEPSHLLLRVGEDFIGAPGGNT